MTARTAFAATAALCVGAAALPAQSAPRYEVGAFGSFVKHDAAFNLDDRFGGGARIGFFFGRNLGLEFDMMFESAHTVPGTSATFEPLFGGGSVVLNLPVADHSVFYLLGGYSRLDFGNTSPYKFVDGAWHAGFGERLRMGGTTALRLEARLLYTPETQSGFSTGSVTHVVGTLGLSVFQLGVPPRDSDGDRVTDRRDACPDTPAGATVDARGCPADEDRDTVLDGMDQCPGTPAGATVDTRGCPADQDSDRVFDGIDTCPDTPAGAAVDATGCPADQDSDRVLDGIDRCPDTPAGATVDQTGCPLDSDGDRVFDGLDQCPNTPAGLTVDATGCLPDEDRDRVPDHQDRCPGTPAGTPVDQNGCPVTQDSDRDGVGDAQDRCPNTPPNTPVDPNGCRILFAEPAPGEAAAPLILRGVNFQTGRSVITLSSYPILDEVAASLVANPDVRIEIAGYTDITGSSALNQRLSQARAEAVRHYLARKGVSPARMVARGYGPANPVAPNDTPEGRALNRRVELHRLP